ncbi:hypothetical protein P5V15_006472 [Pogonomyrmex californicus]
MPRTKRSRTTGNATKDRDAAVKTFEKHVQLRISKMERDQQVVLKGFEAFIEVIVSSLLPEIFQMTLGELIDWQDQKDNDQKENRDDEVSSSVKSQMQPPTTTRKRKNTSKTVKRAITAVSDDGYATGSTSTGSTSRITKAQIRPTSMMRTRSSTRLDNFQTPAMLKSMANIYDVVTPKVKPNTPLNVLRRPRQGEMVLSMQGSPLLVSAVIDEKTANINVPLANGNVMSLLPKEGLRMSNIPPLDPEMMHQLETLKNHIEKVISFK